MKTRINVRTKIIVPVRVLQTDMTGQRTFELAHTVNTSSNGLYLAGFHKITAVDDVIEVRYQHRQARYRVVWTRPGTVKNEFQMGLQCLEPHKHVLTAAETAASPHANEHYTPVSRKNRRREQRYSVEAGAEIKPVRAELGLWTRVSNISRQGCFCYTAHPLPLLTKLKVLIKLGDVEIEQYGVVRSVVAGSGMGLEFTHSSADDNARLHAALERIRSVLDKIRTQSNLNEQR